MKSNLLTLTLSLAILFTGSVFADKPNDQPPPVRVLKIALDLSDQQVADLRDLIQARALEVRGVNGEIQEVQADLEELLKSDAPDPAEVGGLVLDILALKQEIGQGHEAYQQSFRDILTPEQVERLGHINRIALADRAGKVLHKLRLH